MNEQPTTPREDVEGHAIKVNGFTDETGDVDGHSFRGSFTDDADVEGHAYKPGRDAISDYQPTAPKADTDDTDDVEGHGRRL